MLLVAFGCMSIQDFLLQIKKLIGIIVVGIHWDKNFTDIYNEFVLKYWWWVRIFQGVRIY
jgi:hypothetical protein